MTPEEHLQGEVGFDPAVLALIRQATGGDLARCDLLGRFDPARGDWCDEVPRPAIEVFLHPGYPTAEEKQLVATLRAELQPRGYLPVVNHTRGDGYPGATSLIVMDTPDQLEVLRLLNTSGVNYDVTTDDVVAKIADWDHRYGITILEASGCKLTLIFAQVPPGMDTVACRPAEEWSDEGSEFFRELLDFCPSWVYGCWTKEDVFRMLREFVATHELELYWD